MDIQRLAYLVQLASTVRGSFIQAADISEDEISLIRALYQLSNGGKRVDVVPCVDDSEKASAIVDAYLSSRPCAHLNEDEAGILLTVTEDDAPTSRVMLRRWVRDVEEAYDVAILNRWRRMWEGGEVYPKIL